MVFNCHFNIQARNYKDLAFDSAVSIFEFIYDLTPPSSFLKFPWMPLYNGIQNKMEDQYPLIYLSIILKSYLACKRRLADDDTNRKLATSVETGPLDLRIMIKIALHQKMIICRHR